MDNETSHLTSGQHYSFMPLGQTVKSFRKKESWELEGEIP